MPDVLTQPEDQPGRTADRVTRVVVGESHSFSGHSIDVRSLDLLLPVAAEVSIAEVVGHDVDDVRARFGAGRKEWCNQEKGED
jgi:hypothetical protein